MCIYFVLFHLTSSRVYQVLVKNWRWSLLRHAKDKLFYKSKYSAITSSAPSIVFFLNHGAKQRRPYRGRSVVYLSVSDHGRFHQWREEGVGVSGEGRKKVPHCLVCRHPGESCPHLPSASGVDERCEAEGGRGGIQDDYMTCTCLIKATMLCYDRHLHVRGCVWQMWFQCCGSLSLSLSLCLSLSLSVSLSLYCAGSAKAHERAGCVLCDSKHFCEPKDYDYQCPCDWHRYEPTYHTSSVEASIRK